MDSNGESAMWQLSFNKVYFPPELIYIVFNLYRLNKLSKRFLSKDSRNSTNLTYVTLMFLAKRFNDIC